jgi:hypothetical protein
LRVRAASSDPSGRPERDRLQRAASVLSKEGFDVLHVGRFGVSVSSDPEKFSRVFGVKLSGGEVLRVPPEHEELMDLIDTIQIDSDPEYFGSHGKPTR